MPEALRVPADEQLLTKFFTEPPINSFEVYRRLKKDARILDTFPTLELAYLHLDPNSFLRQKSASVMRQILIDAGFPSGYLDPVMQTPELRATLWEDIAPDESGIMTFETDRIYLAFTLEDC